MTQYELTWDGRIMFPEKACYYVAVNKDGKIEGKKVEFPNAIPLGFEPDKYYDAKKVFLW